MASLLPALKPPICPATVHKDSLTYSHLQSRSEYSHTGGCDRRRWGTDKHIYGGVGFAADHVIHQGGIVSRSHRHFGTGNINCYPQKQPYRVTDLLLSDCRPYDQLMPSPLLTDKIIRHKQSCQYPTNHTYTSHRSKFAVFPAAYPTPRGTTSLTPRTSESLRHIHHYQFCTSTYEQTYRNHWKSGGGLSPIVTAGNDGSRIGVLQAEMVAGRSADWRCCKHQQCHCKRCCCNCGERSGGLETERNRGSDVHMKCGCWKHGKIEAASKSECVVKSSVDTINVCKCGDDLGSNNTKTARNSGSEYVGTCTCSTLCDRTGNSDPTVCVPLDIGESVSSDTKCQDCRGGSGTDSKCCTHQIAEDEEQPNCSEAEDSKLTCCKVKQCSTEPQHCTATSAVPASCMVGAQPNCIGQEPVSGDAITAGATEGNTGSGPVTKRTRRVHWEDETEEDKEEAFRQEQQDVRRKDEEEQEEEKSKEGQATQVIEEQEDEGEMINTQRGGKDVFTATTLTQLPDHFRRVSSKYYLSRVWPCTIPFYLRRPHSMLPTYITSPAEPPCTFVKLKEEEPVAMTSPSAEPDETEVRGESSEGGDVPAAGENKERDTAASNACSPPQTGECDGIAVNCSVPGLSTMLAVSGSRIPHRLGVRFRTQAHTRFHELYPDKVPDLREARVESKKYFFHNYHSSVFRGS